MKRIFILGLILFLITGCYDNQELNNINIVTGISIDYIDKEYVINLEVTKIASNKESGSKEKEIFTGHDENMETAIYKAINSSDKETYFKHLNVVLIGENVAKEGISEIMDYLLRDNNISTTFFTTIAKNASEVLDLKIKNDTVSNLIVSTITSHIDTEILNNVDIITSEIINNRKDIALPYIEIDGEEIKIENKAYFEKDRMVGIVSNKIYNFLILGNKNTVFNSDDNVINIYDSKIKYEVLKDRINIKIEGDGKIIGLNKNINLNVYEGYDEIEGIISKKIEQEVIEFLEKTRCNGSDLLGMKDLYYKKYHKEIDNIKYEVDVSVKVKKNGIIMEEIYD